MKPRNLINVTVVGLLALSVCFADSKPDISGTWVLDKTRSFSNPPGFDQTLTIVHKGDEIKVNAKTTARQQETLSDETLLLDGKEREFTPPGAPEGTKGKRKAYWMPGNRGIIVEDETPAPNQATQHVVRKYTLSSDGTTLTIDLYIDTPRFSVEAKRVFNKRV